MSELVTLKKQMATVAARYKAEVLAARKFGIEADEAEESAEIMEEELHDLRGLDVATKAGKQIIAKAVEQFRAAIQKAKQDAKQLAAKARQAEKEADDQYGLGERIYSRIGEYDDRYRFPKEFDDTP